LKASTAKTPTLAASFVLSVLPRAAVVYLSGVPENNLPHWNAINDGTTAVAGSLAAQKIALKQRVIHVR
jgi:hypothetical protein